ncbi:hypothetical protein J3R82DRAFT_5058 [Butyriboletus roseoflavus]|nr:hypothetical protein J3R82DRAFT_5058 [Butyriboletus roseoflavus]
MHGIKFRSKQLQTAGITCRFNHKDPVTIPPHADPTAWAILWEFAATDIVKDALGTCYKDSDWQPAFKAIIDTENDTDVATPAIKKLAHAAANLTGLKIRIPARSAVPQLETVRNDVTQSILDLKA